MATQCPASMSASQPFGLQLVLDQSSLDVTYSWSSPSIPNFARFAVFGTNSSLLQFDPMGTSVLSTGAPITFFVTTALRSNPSARVVNGASVRCCSA